MVLGNQIIVWFATNTILTLPTLVAMHLLLYTLNMGPVECFSTLMRFSKSSTKYSDVVEQLLSKSELPISGVSLVYFAIFFGMMGLITFAVNM
ncbi:hypothetical protein X943_003328 [Babesia divergens]|uniref:Uncharacterized protein n=1 Tax=Babesia divergens TaxID=32595 RepID=A0AAD9GFL4_BABDI|nr:hypothetical protein X943_003328 [Babesia divergens]